MMIHHQIADSLTSADAPGVWTALDRSIRDLLREERLGRLTVGQARLHVADLGQRIEQQLRTGSAVDDPTAEQTVERMRVALREIDQPVLELRILEDLARALRAQGRFAVAALLLDDGINLARQMGDATQEGRMLRLQGHVHRQMGRLVQADAFTQRSLVCARAMGEPRDESASLNGLGTIAFEMGRWTEAGTFYTGALMLADAHDLALLQAQIANNLGVLRLLTGNADEALSELLKSIALNQRSGDDGLLVLAYYNLGMVYLEKGQWAASESNFDQSGRLNGVVGNQQAVAMTHLGRAMLAQNRHDLLLARRLAGRALDAFGWLGDDLGLADGQKVLGLIQIRMGQLAEAHASLTNSLTTCERLGAPLGVIEAQEGLAEYHLTRAEFGAADRLLESAIAGYDALTAPTRARAARNRLTSLRALR